ncbi:MAG: UDP-N-acetylmuramoyl-tripeptide--D-alanyl-D-alanine ligase [bacterium]
MKQLLKNLVIGLLWKRVGLRVLRERPVVIAVTGSVGKTSTKDAIALVLEKGKRQVVKTVGGLNSDIGVPLSLCGFDQSPATSAGWLKVLARVLLMPPRLRVHKGAYYVLEYSADKPGDIAYLASKLAPNVAVLTRVVPVHMQSYASLEDLAAEKFSLVAGLKSEGQAVLNADDPIQVAKGKELSNVLWYGVRESALKQPGIWGHSLRLGEKGWIVQIDFVIAKKMDSIARQQMQTIQVESSLIGRHQVDCLVAAAAVGFQQGIPFDAIRTALQGYQVPPGRGRLIPGRRDVEIIDDSYNSSPESAKAGLEMLRPFARKRRVVAILGNMNELGELTESSHIEVARHAAGKVDYLVAVGPQSTPMVRAAEEAGMPSHQVLAFQTPEQLLDKIDQIVNKGDLVYIKGSQNKVRLERAVKALMAHPEHAEQLLARQSAFWRHHP